MTSDDAGGFDAGDMQGDRDAEGDGLDDRLDRAVDAADTSDAEASLAVLRGIRAELAETSARLPSSAEVRDDFGRCLAAEGRCHARAGRLDDAIEATREAIGHHVAAASIDPLHRERGGSIAALHVRCADYLGASGRLAEAVAEGTTAARIADACAAADPEEGRALAVSADAHETLASIRSRLGDTADAVVEREAVLARTRQIQRLATSDSAVAAGVSAALRDLAWTLRDTGEWDRSLAALGEATRLLESVAAGAPSEVRWQKDLATTHAMAGVVLRESGSFAAAIAELERATFLTEAIVSLEPGDTEATRQLVRRHEEMGDLRMDAGDATAAIDAYRLRLDAAVQLFPGDATAEGRARLDLGSALLASGDAAAAVVELEASCARLATDQDGDLDAAASLGHALDRLADARAATGDADGELAACGRLADVRRTVSSRVPDHAGAADLLLTSLGRLGGLFGEHGRENDAESVFRDAVATAERCAARPGAPRNLRVGRIVAHARLGQCLVLRGRPSEAVPHLRQAIAGREDLLRDEPGNDGLLRLVGWDHRRLAQALGRAGDIVGSENELATAAALADAALEREPESVDWLALASAVHDVRGDLLEERGDLRGAAESAEREAECVARQVEVEPGDDARHASLASRQGEAAELRSRIGDHDAALRHRRAAVATCRRRVGAAPGEVPPLRSLSTALDALGREILAAAGNRAGASEAAGGTSSADASDNSGSGAADGRRAAAERALVPLREALAIDDGLVLENPADESLRRALAISHNAIHFAAKSAGLTDESILAITNEVGIRRELAAPAPSQRDSGQHDDGRYADDARALRWSIYGLASALRDAGRTDDARAPAREALGLCEAACAAAPGDLDALGLLGNVREVHADLLDRADPAQRDEARRLYAANVEIYRAHRPEDLSHEADCTCLADCERKLAELTDLGPLGTD
ncbi:MAG: hypothetical protein K8T90_20695 [Planctomycetes bacterium]|nr:hypothetical protein [Planctomycetota bacterium]